MSNEKQSTLETIINQRKEKVEKIKELGVNPYAYNFSISEKSKEIIDNYDKFESKEVVIAGRLMAIRKMGKASFANITDSAGKIQLYVSKKDIGEDSYAIFKMLDIGDFIGCKGTVMKTRTGETTVKVLEMELLTKNIRPLPIVKEKDGVLHDTFSDKELRYRKRYLDLILNPEVKETFVKRTKIMSATRKFFDDLGYLEVETPILQPIYGGANARPFETYHNTLGMNLFLRIADELYLKRLIIGGFDKVYEICKNFRNEGMDKSHNPEFSVIEFYQAYVDFEYMMNLVEKYFKSIAEMLNLTTIEYDGNTIDFTKPFERKSMFDLFETYLGVDIKHYGKDEMISLFNDKKYEYDPKWNYGQLIDKLFDEVVEPNLIQPTFVTDYPKEISPLAKVKRDGDERLVERFELFIGKREYANSFSELTDPIDQRERLESQAKLRDEGDKEAQIVDEDFLQAMEYGMPPTGGVGIGLDRVIMLMTGQTSIKDVLLFPQMKKEHV
ncbi:MAG: lysine--tRNA ligase [Candidatus Marinimicrobia bacterium]|nr:lysine--tRNA ligase [Candidatus Neomarinimicrobiota bacterium]